MGLKAYEDSGSPFDLSTTLGYILVRSSCVLTCPYPQFQDININLEGVRGLIEEGWRSDVAPGVKSFQLSQWDVTTPSYTVLICKLKITVHPLVWIVMRIKYWMLNKIWVSAENTQLCYHCCTNFSCINQVGVIQAYVREHLSFTLSCTEKDVGFRWGSMQKLKPSWEILFSLSLCFSGTC